MSRSIRRTVSRCDLRARGLPRGRWSSPIARPPDRGRLNRGWQSPPGSNLYFSVDSPSAGRSVGCRADHAAGRGGGCGDDFLGRPAGVGIKWPNDVRIRGRKVCGILSEMRTAGGSRARHRRDRPEREYPERRFRTGHIDTATSLREETGRCHSREELFVLLCERLERWYAAFLRDGFVRSGQDGCSGRRWRESACGSSSGMRWRRGWSQESTGMGRF